MAGRELARDKVRRSLDTFWKKYGERIPETAQVFYSDHALLLYKLGVSLREVHVDDDIAFVYFVDYEPGSPWPHKCAHAIISLDSGQQLWKDSTEPVYYWGKRVTSEMIPCPRPNH